MTSPSRRNLLAAGISAFFAPPALAAERGWPGSARAAVSLTYDDGLNSQLQYAVPELDRRGLKATFFLTEENMAEALPGWEKVAASGHEIADHTVTHPCDLRRFSAADYEKDELAPMERFLNQNFAGHSLKAFAYPCGYLGLGAGDRARRYARYQRLLHADFEAARTTAGGPNLLPDIAADRFHLHAFEPTYDADVVGPGARYLRRAAREGGWAILVFHNVVPRWQGEGDASIRVHARILDLVQAHDLWCAPMGAVLERLGLAEPPGRRADWRPRALG